MNTLEAFHMRCQRLMYAGRFMSPMQRCFSDLVYQPLVTSYVINAYLCLAMLHAWTLEYQHMMLYVWSWIPTKAERQWSAREDRQVALSTSSSTSFRRIPTLYCYLRCGDPRSPWVTERRSGHLEYATTMMVMMMMNDVRLASKIEGKTNFSRHLQAVQNRDCWMFENRWRKV